MKLRLESSMNESSAGDNHNGCALQLRFLVTDGILVRLGPPHAELGDIITFFFFMLRPQEDKFRLNRRG